MITDKPIKNLFTWGDTVTVSVSAPTLNRPTNIGDIVGFRQANSEQTTEDKQYSGYLYSVEFGNGETIDIPESLLMLI